VSLIKGDKGSFWSFVFEETNDESSCAEEDDMSALPPAAVGAARKLKAPPEPESETDATLPPPGEPQKVEMKVLPSLHRYQGLRGILDEEHHTSNKKRVRVIFPCGAPPKAFAREAFFQLPQGAPMTDKLTQGTLVFLSRGPGVHAAAQRYLNGQQPQKRAIARMLGYNDFYKKFNVSLSDADPTGLNVVSLTFAQTGVLAPYVEEGDDASSDDTKDVKKEGLDTSSEEEGEPVFSVTVRSLNGTEKNISQLKATSTVGHLLRLCADAFGCGQSEIRLCRGDQALGLPCSTLEESLVRAGTELTLVRTQAPTLTAEEKQSMQDKIDSMEGDALESLLLLLRELGVLEEVDDDELVVDLGRLTLFQQQAVAKHIKDM